MIEHERGIASEAERRRIVLSIAQDCGWASADAMRAGVLAMREQFEG